MKYQITVTEEQLRVILKTLDLYSRMGMGQLEVVEEFLRLHFWNRVSLHQEAVSQGISEIKRLLWDFHPSSSWGIYNQEVVSQECREAYDIQQVVRKAHAEQRLQGLDEEAGKGIRYSVSMSDYLPSNPEWPPVTIKVVLD